MKGLEGQKGAPGDIGTVPTSLLKVLTKQKSCSCIQMSSLCFSKGPKGPKGQRGDSGKGLPGHDGHQGLRGNLGAFSYLVHLVLETSVFTLGSVNLGLFEYASHTWICNK